MSAGDGEGISRFITDQNRVKWGLLLGTIFSATILRLWREAIRVVEGVESGVRLSFGGIVSYVRTELWALALFLVDQLDAQADLGAIADFEAFALPAAILTALIALAVIAVGVILLVDE